MPNEKHLGLPSMGAPSMRRTGSQSSSYQSPEDKKVIDCARLLVSSIERTTMDILSSTQNSDVLLIRSDAEKLFNQKLSPTYFFENHGDFDPALARYITQHVVQYMDSIKDGGRKHEMNIKSELLRKLLPYLVDEKRKKDLETRIQLVFDKANALDNCCCDYKQATWRFDWPQDEGSFMSVTPAFYKDEKMVLEARTVGIDCSDETGGISQLPRESASEIPSKALASDPSSQHKEPSRWNISDIYKKISRNGTDSTKAFSKRRNLKRLIYQVRNGCRYHFEGSSIDMIPPFRPVQAVSVPDVSVPIVSSTQSPKTTRNVTPGGYTSNRSPTSSGLDSPLFSSGECFTNKQHLPASSSSAQSNISLSLDHTRRLTTPCRIKDTKKPLELDQEHDDTQEKNFNGKSVPIMKLPVSVPSDFGL